MFFVFLLLFEVRISTSVIKTSPKDGRPCQKARVYGLLVNRPRKVVGSLAVVFIFVGGNSRSESRQSQHVLHAAASTALMQPSGMLLRIVTTS